jgi:hypothetical protein
MASSGMLSHVALVRTDVSEERVAYTIRVKRISELDRILRNVGSYKSHAVLTSQKTPFFIVTAIETSNLT